MLLTHNWHLIDSRSECFVGCKCIHAHLLHLKDIASWWQEIIRQNKAIMKKHNTGCLHSSLFEAFYSGFLDLCMLCWSLTMLFLYLDYSTVLRVKMLSSVTLNLIYKISVVVSAPLDLRGSAQAVTWPGDAMTYKRNRFSIYGLQYCTVFALEKRWCKCTNVV